MKKLLIIPILFLILINISQAIQADNDTLDVRFDIGYITFNQSDQGVRGYGSWISNFFSKLKARLGILSLVDLVNPNVTLISPVDNYENGTNTMTFVFNVTDTYNIKSCSIYIYEIDHLATNNSINKTINNSITTSFVITGGWYWWYINCTDGFGNIGQSGQRRFRGVFEPPPVVYVGIGIGTGAPGTGQGMNITYLCKRVGIFLEEYPNYTYWDIEALRYNISSEISILPGKNFINQFVDNYDLFCLDVEEEPKEDIKKITERIKEKFKEEYEEFKKDIDAQIKSLIIFTILIVFTVLMIQRKRRIVKAWLIKKGFIKENSMLKKLP